MSSFDLRPVLEQELPLSEIEANPDQPRTVFNDSSIEELARNIERTGLLNAIIVSPYKEKKGYFIVAGERRFRAHQLLERETIRATVIHDNIDLAALSENIQREDLNPIDEAEALSAFLDNHEEYTQAQLASDLGKARSTVANLIGIARQLHSTIKSEAKESPIASKSRLIELSKIKEKEKQLEHWNAMKNGESGRTVKEMRQEKASIKASEKTVLDSQEPRQLEDTRNYEIREYLLNKVLSHIDEQGYSREEAAKHLATSQPRLTHMFQKRIEDFTIDALINMLDSAGIQVKIETSSL